MRLYLNGLENTTHRETMRKAGVLNACFSFSYMLRYKKKKDWAEEFSFLDSVIARAGNCPNWMEYEDFTAQYVEFLSTYEGEIDFAMEVPEKYWDGLDIRVSQHQNNPRGPFYGDVITFDKRFFNEFGSYTLNDLIGLGIDFHAVGFYELPRFDIWQQISSCNVSHWLLGKYGLTYFWRNDKLEVYGPDELIIRRKIADKLGLDGNRIRYNDWKEVNYMNCIAFMGLQKWLMT